MKKTLLITALFAAATCNAQVVLWDGEDEAVTSRNEYGGWWDRGNPSVVDNPDKSGINTSSKCLKFTMTGNDFGQKHLACPFRDWMNADNGNQLNLNGNRRFSLMVKKAQNDNLLVELSDPTNGADNYWQKTAAWYGGEGKWQKVVLDFSTNEGMNDFPGVLAITAQTGDVTSPQDVYIDNVVVEPMPMVNGTSLKDIADNSLTGSVKVTGSLMRGDCQNANGDWFRVDFDDFALLKDKLAADATGLDLRGVILKDPYWDQIQEKCPYATIYLDNETIPAVIEPVTPSDNTQIIIWDGEDETITSLNAYGGWWDRGNPSVVDNPDKTGINTSNKCLKFTMTGNDFGQKHLACPFRDWMNADNGNQLNLNGNRRFSLMVKKAQNENLLVELSDPTNGADNYWQKTAAWYGSEGQWQKVVLDFSTNEGLNDFPGVFAITAQTGDVTSPQDVYIDNVVVEPMPMVDNTLLKDIADNSLTGSVKVTGSLMRGDCQNANGDWFRVDYDDFALLKDKLAADATELNLRGVILKDAYWDQILEKCPGITIILDGEIVTAIQTVKAAGSAADNRYFTLSGQQVARPTKGLYIVNGKKVIVK